MHAMQTLMEQPEKIKRRYSTVKWNKRERDLERDWEKNEPESRLMLRSDLTRSRVSCVSFVSEN